MASQVLQSRSNSNPLRFLWSAMAPKRRRQFFIVLIVLLIGAALELVTIGAVLPFLAVVSDPQRAQDFALFNQWITFFGGDAWSMLLTSAAILVLASVAATIFRLLLTWISLRFVLTFSNEISVIVFGRMMRQPYSYFVMHNTSEHLAGVQKVQTVVWGVLMPGMQAITAAVVSIAIIALLFAIDPLTASIAAAAMSLSYLLVSISVRSRLHRNSERLATSATERIQIIQEGLGGIRDVLLDQSQDLFEAKYSRMDYLYCRSQGLNNFIVQAPRYVIEATGIVLIACLAVYLSTRPGGVIAAFPILGALALGAQRLLPLLQQVYAGWSAAAGNRQMLYDVVDLMSAPIVAAQPRDRKQPVKAFRDNVRLQDVGFQYQDRDYALQGVNLIISRGARIGFVGETGSGKSTLLDLIMGLLQPTEGQILIDGKALTDGNRSNWQAQIAHVPQTIFLSDSSIASNIAFGEGEADIDMNRVRDAAAMAHIDTFISNLPAGYETTVGERGVRLSGGQRQRIGIARALYKRAPVLIFDEATSALDDSTEKAIMRSIDSVGDDVTLLMIAHRTSTLTACDHVVRLAAGKIVHAGSYAEVVGPPTLNG